ncbi:MAG: glycosyltransferase family 4 protein [Nitrosospira sp.]|nr:glycosyltransferase family 4 protein [Nitrosospira sp.]
MALIALHFSEYSANLALALAEHCDVLLVLYQENADKQLGHDWRTIFKGSRAEVLVLNKPKSVSSVFRNTWRIVSRVKRYAPEIIHYQEEIRDELVLGLIFIRTIPTVLTIHDPTPHSGTDSNRLRYSRYRLYLPLMRYSADMAITHGCTLSDSLVKNYPRFIGKVRTIPHGPLGLNCVKEGSEESLRTDGYRLLFFGRIHEYKGLRYFIDSVTALRNKGYPVTGVVAGQGNDLECHRQQMENAGCFEILDRYISAEEIPGLFLESFAVILPYVDGTQSGVAAMALGFARPVVASAVGSIPELVRDRENGLLVPPRDVLALVEAIETLLIDKQLWKRLARGAGELRDGELSWGVIAAKTMSAYDSVVEMQLDSA